MPQSKMSVTQLTLLTILNMLGSGIIMLPAKIASVGGIGLLSWGIVCVSAVAMAYAFAYCGMYSKHTAGLGSIAENAFGDFGCFLTNVSYALALLLANIAITISTVTYLFAVLDIPLSSQVMPITTVVMLWFATLINLPGSRFTGRISAITVWGIFIPMVVLLCALPFYFSQSIFEANWNPLQLNDVFSFKTAVPMMFWSFLGLESAFANSDSVENPEKTVPTAVLIATVVTAVLYIAVSTLIVGALPNEALVSATAPFCVIFNTIFSPTVGKVLALLMFLALFGSLMGWQFTMSQVFKISADHGHLPSIFNQGMGRNIPAVGLLIITFFQTFGILAAPIMDDIFLHFENIVEFSTLLNVLPYLTCMAAAFTIVRSTPTDPVHDFSVRIAAGISLAFLVGYFAVINNDLMKFMTLFLLFSLATYGVLVAKRNPNLIPKHQDS